MRQQLIYDDLFIGSLDQAYLDKLEDSAMEVYSDLDIGLCEIYPGMPLINQLVDYLYREVIYSLDISDASKEKLSDAIHLNALCSCIDTTIDKFPEEEHDEIEKVLSL